MKPERSRSAFRQYAAGDGASSLEPEAPAECRHLDSDHELALLEEIVESDGAFSLELSERVRGACLDYVAAAGARELADCFGWTSRGKHFIGRRLAEARLLVAMADAWDAMEGREHLERWPRCCELLSEMADFEANFLPAWRSSGPPAKASRLRGALYRAFTAVSRPLPKTENGLYELLRRAGVFK